MLILDGRTAKSRCRRVLAAILENQDLPHTYLIFDKTKQMLPEEKHEENTGRLVSLVWSMWSNSPAILFITFSRPQSSDL